MGRPARRDEDEGKRDGPKEPFDFGDALQLLREHGHTEPLRYTANQFEYWFWRCLRADIREAVATTQGGWLAVMAGVGSIFGKQAGEQFLAMLTEMRQSLATEVPKGSTPADRLVNALQKLVTKNG